MALNTTNYGFNLPEVDGSEDLWGDLLNQNWTDLDALLLARDQSISALEGRTLTAGDGLSGGGDLTQDRTISVDSSVVRTSQSIAAGDGLTGGGDLSANRTVAMGTPGTLNGGTSNNVTGDSHTHAITSTASRTDSSTTTLLQAAGMDNHRTSGDHDARYARLAGGAAADFTSMPLVGGVPVVESGSNSDGRWVRWADGSQQCWVGRFSVNIRESVARLGRFWSYPSSFTEDPAVMTVLLDFGSLQNIESTGRADARVTALGPAAAFLNVYRISGAPGFESGDAHDVAATAVGRWR